MSYAPPAFPFYAADFLVGTMRFTNEQVGAYLRCLCYEWQNGGIAANDPQELACIMATSIRKAKQIWSAIGVKFHENSYGLFYNTRLEHERATQLGYHGKQRANGQKGGRASALKRASGGSSGGSSVGAARTNPFSLQVRTSLQQAAPISGSDPYAVLNGREKHALRADLSPSDENHHDHTRPDDSDELFPIEGPCSDTWSADDEDEPTLAAETARAADLEAAPCAGTGHDHERGRGLRHMAGADRRPPVTGGLPLAASSGPDSDSRHAPALVATDAPDADDADAGDTGATGPDDPPAPPGDGDRPAADDADPRGPLPADIERVQRLKKRLGLSAAAMLPARRAFRRSRSA